MINYVANIGRESIKTIQQLGKSGIFILILLMRKPNFKKLFPEVLAQTYFLGVLSCLIIGISGLFIGMVVGLQGYNTLAKFGSASQLGQILALSIVRELGPVMSALLFAGRAGSSLTAEIGLMKATSQIDCMTMMGVDPQSHIIYPRFVAGLMTLPILSLICSMIGIYGGYLVGVEWLGVDAGSFWSNMQSQVNFRIDIFSGLIKSLIFGFLIMWIAVYQGFICTPNAKGISEATTRTVVYSAVCILGFDFLLTAIMIGDW